MQSRASALVTLESKRPLIVSEVTTLWRYTNLFIIIIIINKSCIVNRHIGVGDSKNVIVFDPLLMRHVIWRMRSGSVHIFTVPMRYLG